tara:strand:- start:198 stop:389 length:192 start_codon:yes stop_codon:yes gene_type:complete
MDKFDEKPEPLGIADKILLHAFMEILQDEPKPHAYDNFYATCDMLEHAVAAVFAARRIKRLGE